MSIIEETLRKLQTNQESGKAKEKDVKAEQTDEPKESAKPKMNLKFKSDDSKPDKTEKLKKDNAPKKRPMPKADDAPPEIKEENDSFDDFQTGGKKKSRLRVFITITIALVCIAIAIHKWSGVIKNRNEKRAQAVYSAQNAFPLITNRDKPVPGKETLKKDKSLATRDALLKKKTGEPVPPINPASNEKAKSHASNLNGLSSMMDDIEVNNIVSSINVDADKTAKDNGKPIVNKSMAEKAARLDIGWISDGAAVMNVEGIDSALMIWDHGFTALPDTHILLVINVFEDKDSAKYILDKIGNKHSAFIISKTYREKDSYYLISSPPRGELWQTQDEIIDILSTSRHDRLPSVFLKGNLEEKVIAWMLNNKNGVVKDTPLAIGNEPVKKEKPPLTPEERIKEAKKLIQSGAYKEAAKLLEPKRGEEADNETWENYLLLGTARLGAGNLERAEQSFDKGLALNSKQPQLWLQRAIVEQQKGNHETALQLLKECQKLAPAMPEVQLNIGYSIDTIGADKYAAKMAYETFIELTEGNPAYIAVRQKVLERLVILK